MFVDKLKHRKLDNRIIYFFFISILSACHSGSSTASTDRVQEEKEEATDTNMVDSELSPETKESLDRILDEKMRIDVSDTAKIP